MYAKSFALAAVFTLSIPALSLSIAPTTIAASQASARDNASSNPVTILTQSSASRKIITGEYTTNNFEQSIIVKGRRYMYSDETGINPWQPVSKLVHIRRGVFFRHEDKDYYCLTALKPKTGYSSCTARGWKRETAE
jgi:hypothetical protein